MKTIYVKFQENKDSKGLYSFTKKKMGWKNGGTPQSFQIDGKMYTKPKIMADLQMNFYQNKIKKLVTKLPPQTANPLSTLQEVMRRWGRSQTIPELRLRNITPSEVVTLIKNMGKSHSFGIDGIDSESLKV